MPQRKAFELNGLPDNFQFDLNRFMASTNGGQIFLQGLSNENKDAFLNYIDNENIKLRVCVCGEYLYIKHPSVAEEIPGGCLSCDVYALNNTMSGDIATPIESTKSGRRRIPNVGDCEPDQSFVVIDRTTSCPNLVMETRSRNKDLNYNEWFQMLRNYFNAPGVMVVLGVIILWDHEPHQSPLIFVAFFRDPNVDMTHPLRQPDYLVSFGNMHPSHESRVAIEAAAGGAALTGFGFGGPPCTELPVENFDYYQVPVPAHLMLMIDNEGLQFHQAPAVGQVMKVNLVRMGNRTLAYLR